MFNDSWFGPGTDLLHVERGCQDYAQTIRKANHVMVALSDGCSDSKNTDVGARELIRVALDECLAGITIYIPLNDIQSFPLVQSSALSHQIVSHIQPSYAVYGPNYLDATLIMAHHIEDKLYVNVFGDGFVCVKKKNGAVSLRQIYYTQNAANYLSYQLNADNLAKYTNFEQDLVVTEFLTTGGSSAPDVKVDKYKPTDPIVFVEELDQLESVFIFSDGLASFVDENGSPVLPLTVASEIMNFQNYDGEFLKRRMVFLERGRWKKRKWSHEDDLSVASIIWPNTSSVVNQK